MRCLVSVVIVVVGLLTNHPRAVIASTDEKANLISIGKCCEPGEILVDDTCTPLKETNETEWRPKFVEEKVNGISRSRQVEPNYQLKIGKPKCQSNEHQWNVYHRRSGEDRLAILTNGILRHYTTDLAKRTEDRSVYGLDPEELMDEEDLDTMYIHYDYPFGHYCADKTILTTDRLVTTYAMVCVPDVVVTWTDTNYLMRHAIDPAFHAMSIASYLIVAVVYFVLPQLRDLVGNMITSMTLCLIAGQCASMVRIFTEFGSHVSFMVADTVMYVSLLAAFFWLNALGYYVWSTFRSRNVFLRVTDGRKYCYYSTYVWSSTVCIAGSAIFAHFALETSKPVITGTIYPPQETIGWLGVSVLFTAIALTILVDLSFVLTTANRIKRMSTYGRIHHKMKYSFRMFVFLFVLMSTGWVALLLSRLNYDVLVYCQIVINLFQAISILYVCVFGQRRVTFLLGKTCNCCNSRENIEGLDWGEEMTAINAGY
ncbi:probable G-protein coupled receptor Mth-like 5 [Hylaeus anthracinus]|uniref:probable G-protein coupled receptor Mth-like 5 n=1 Tax=Hylaeus anthracinus TaxID=313031 RepID=UPI0023B95967|nr:probable G-protein coupled receptor Mth-like 5 [Hylaeus anthracinus]